MRNGLNISNVSELADELGKKSAEVEVRYQARVALHPDRLVANALTTRAGTIRIARDFRVEGARAGKRGTDALPAPLEYAQVAITGCGLATFVHGMSAKGATLSRLGMDAAAEHRRGPDGDDLTGLRYILDVEADCADEVVVEIARRASQLSPSYRTVLEPNELALQLLVRGDGHNSAQRAWTVGADGSSVELRVEFPDLLDELRCELRWQYGMLSVGHVHCSSRAGRRPVAVDQPKQYFGRDKAATPQEHLLMALGMDLASGVAEVADAPPRAVEVALGGSLDLRGPFRVDPSAEVRLHRIEASLTLQVDDDPESWLDRVEQVASRSAVRRLVCNPKAIDVEVRAGGRQLGADQMDD